jgi:hypothetical protein
MNDPKDKDAKDLELDTGASDKRSGRAAFDERGNSVWEWQLETGVYSRDVNTQRLKKLDLDELSIADTAAHERPSFGQETKPGGGFNPYNTGPKSSGSSPYDSALSFADKAKLSVKEDRPRTLDDMRKLSEAIKKQKEQEQK